MSKLDLLILNPYSAEFSYVPMGTFGICDYLERSGFRARVVNLALSHPCEVRGCMDAALQRYEPRHVGVILQWKETLPSFLTIADHVHRTVPDVPIWAGGMTASYFAADLLHSSPISGVVRGDSEIPLAEICDGAPAQSIPNLLYRKGSEIAASKACWVADAKALDAIRFGRLDFLDAHPDYLRRIDERLGLPLAIGRGCAYDCGYCGGSRSAFQLHSSRSAIALRDPGTIVADLELCLRHGARQFLLSHTEDACRGVLEAIRQRFPGPLPFSLNLESWTVPSSALLEEFAALRCAEPSRPRHVLLTLRGAANRAVREAERSRATHAADRALELADDIQVTLFSGYYAPWHGQRETLEEDLRFGIEFDLAHQDGRARAAFMAFSTDPASRWSVTNCGLVAAIDLQSIARGTFDEKTVTNNLLLHRPRELPVRDAERFLRVWSMDRTLRDTAPRLWQLITTVLPFEEYCDILGRASAGIYLTEGDRVVKLSDDGIDATFAAIAFHMRDAGLAENALSQFVELILAARFAHRVRSVTAMRDEPPAYLCVSPDAVLRRDYDFTAVLHGQRMGRPVDRETFSELTAKRGDYWYLLLPDVSASQSRAEIEQLRHFNGISPTSSVIERLSETLGAPAAAVEARMRELWRDGVLVTLDAA